MLALLVGPQLTYDAYAPSHLTAAQYDMVLEDTPLAGCGAYFESMEDAYGVNGLFAVAVCHLESGLGRYQANRNNFFGFLSPGGWMCFDSPEDGIDYFGELLSGPIYAGKTIDQIAAVYCPGNGQWAGDVRWLMEYHFERIGG